MYSICIHLFCTAICTAGTDRVVKIKHENEKGVSVTTENIIGHDALAAKITTKYTHAPWNLNVDKFTIDPKGDLKGEVSMDGPAPGLKLKGVADNKLKGEGGFEYTTSALAVKVIEFYAHYCISVLIYVMKGLFLVIVLFFLD